MTEANVPEPKVSSPLRTLRSTKLMPITTVFNLWAGLGLALFLLTAVVASLSLYALRLDQATVIASLKVVLPFALIATAATSLVLSAAYRPTPGVEHTISTLSVLVPWIVVAGFVGPSPLIYAPISAALCLIALLFAKPREAGHQEDGVEAGGYVAPRSGPVFGIVFAVGLGLLLISAVVYVGWFVQVLVDPTGLIAFFSGNTVDSIRLRSGERPSALAVAIAGFYGNLLIGGILFAIGRPQRAKKPIGTQTTTSKSAVASSQPAVGVDGVAKKSLLRNKGFMAVAGWFVLNTILSLVVVALVGFGPDPTVQMFYLLHMALSWLTLSIWFFARIGKNGLLWVGIVVGFITMLIILSVDLVLSFMISLL